MSESPSRPRTRYTTIDGLSIAFQVLGEGPPDLVYASGWLSNVEYGWRGADFSRFFKRLSSFSRLIMFDKRGTGLSDRDVGFPTLEQRTDDIRAVMDASGSQKAALVGVSEGGNMATLFAATYPDRTSALVLFGCGPKGSWAPDYPWRMNEQEIDTYLAAMERDWGLPIDLSEAAPSVAEDPEAREWFAAYLRFAASPRAAERITRLNFAIDVRSILPAVQVPTLVVCRQGDRWASIGESRYLADQIPGARLVELPGDDHLPWWGDQDAVVEEIQEFLTGVREDKRADRALLTLLMTDIIGSTERASVMGDRAWRELLQRHDDLVRRQVAGFDGEEINTTGDGFLIAFTGPTRAIECAKAVRRELRSIDLDVRAGLHAGECERRGTDLSGIAVHIAARVMSSTKDGCILVSATVKDLVVGSGLEFVDHGTHALKGVPGDWQLFRVLE